MPDSRDMAQASTPSVQIPKHFDRAGLKLLKKTAALIDRIGGHALAAFADQQDQCHYHASSALGDMFHTEEATDFFRHQLVEQFHGGRPVISEFMSGHCTMSLQTAQSVRQATWDQRMPTQNMAHEIVVRFPDSALCLYMVPGPSASNIQSHCYSTPQLQNIFSQKACTQHVGQAVSLLPHESPAVSHDSPIAQQIDAPKRPKRTSPEQEQLAPAGTATSQRCKL